MAEQRITIEIDEHGKLQAKTEGFRGETCINELEELLEGIAEITNVKKTDEYYQQIQKGTKNIQQTKG